MNRILFKRSEFDCAEPFCVTGTRAAHIHAVLKAEPGDIIRVGLLNGAAGRAVVLATDPGVATLRFLDFNDTPPEPWADLILALPRPRAMKRLWPQLAALGVGRIILLNASKVEKTYFGSRVISPEIYEPLLVAGITQAGTTRLPKVTIAPRFGAFFTHELPGLLTPATVPLLAHPREARPVPWQAPGGATPRPLLAIGPDGGWTDEETAAFRSAGFRYFSLGTRPLRTDTACTAALAILHYLIETRNPA